MRTIIVGVDGSDPSLRALEFAASLVDDCRDAQLIVVHARYLPYLWAPKSVGEAEFADLLDAAERFVREESQRELDARPVQWSF